MTKIDNCLLYTVYVAIVRRSPVIKCKSVNTFSELDTVVILLELPVALSLITDDAPPCQIRAVSQ